MRTHLIINVFLFVVLTSCYTQNTLSVAYQSVRTHHAQPTKERPIPDEAKIAVAYTISNKGELTAIVYNRTSEIMTIDQTKSFFVNSDGKSTSYYDPTIRTESTTNMSSSSKGASINLGSIAGALGIGGIVGSLANGINVGGSGTSGNSVTNTTYFSDLPQVSIAPHGNGAMSKVFNISGLGRYVVYEQNVIPMPMLNEEQSYCKFSVCISYSFDNGQTYDKIVTNFYANSKLVMQVPKRGHVNEQLQKIYSSKPDAVNENLWILNFNTQYHCSNTGYAYGILFDYN